MKFKLLIIILSFAGILASTIKLNEPTIIDNKSSPLENEPIAVKDEYSIEEPYQYSVLPGTKEWNQLSSTQERKEACKVSKDILSNMTTDALIETIVTYPFFTDVNAFDTLDMGLEALNAEFGGIEELLKRNDAYESTLSFINNISPDYLNLKVEDDWDTFMEKSFVVSKWGYYGVFYHELTDCPYYSTSPNISYWN